MLSRAEVETDPAKLVPPIVQRAAGPVLLVHVHHERAVVRVRGSVGHGPVEDLYVKVDADAVRHGREVAALEACGPADVGSGRGRFVVPGLRWRGTNPWPTLVLGAVEGDALSVRDEPERWGRVAAVLASFRAAPPRLVGTSPWAAEVDRLRAYASGGVELSSAQRRLVDEAATVVRAVRAGHFVHGDAQPDHFLLPGRPEAAVGVIDLADATIGDGAFDIAVLTLDAPERIPDIVAAAPLAERADLEHRVGHYQVLRWATEARWLREHGFDPSGALDRLAVLAGG